MRPGQFPQLKHLALALAPVGLITLIWVFWSSTAGFLAAAIVGFVVLVSVCLWVLPARLVARDTAAAELEPDQRATTVNAARTTLVQGLVGMAALAGIFVAWQQLQTDREQSRTDRQQLREQLPLTRQGQVAERFTRAVDQLGSDKLEQRLGGIYGLERIAKDSPDTDIRLVVAEVLTAYVRQHAGQFSNVAPGPSGAVELSTRAPDVQAVMTVLGRRTTVVTDPPLNLPYVDLRGANLRGAQLQRAYLYGARLDQARLDGAQLQKANLYGTKLEGAVFRMHHCRAQILGVPRVRILGVPRRSRRSLLVLSCRVPTLAVSSCRTPTSLTPNCRVRTFVALSCRRRFSSELSYRTRISRVPSCKEPISDLLNCMKLVSMKPRCRM
jgi:Pentapeptide repeats (8 copies)